ncbi:MAG TPA: retropepsin-like aspartic protease [Kofleriaceae bacterium]|nr:retropepsin-like aspartic protease [Kofleriaceae bacterium]
MQNVIAIWRLAVLVLVGGCAIGAPPGFSTGNTWTFPLVDPLADGRLVVPVTIHGHGPYLFEIDRDARTVIDPHVAADLGLPVSGTRLDDYHDTTHPGLEMEVTDIEVGDLTLSYAVVAGVLAPNRFDDDGRRIYGILGREVLADSAVFGFDRDRGIAWIQSENAFQPPAGATALSLSNTSSSGTKVYWQPVIEGVEVGGVAVDMHPTFAAVPSELDRDKWHAASLAPLDWGLDLVDPSGTARHVDQLGVADRVDVTDTSVMREHVAFAPYGDQRFPFYHLDGTLGLDFFRPYSVAADWHHGKLYLKPRDGADADAKLRFARWGDDLATCLPDCAHIELLPPRDDRPAQPILEVHTDPSVTGDLELVVRATTKSGKPLPILEINLPHGVHGLASRLESRYLGAQVAVVDASPFPRFCPESYTGGGCIMRQAAQVP